MTLPGSSHGARPTRRLWPWATAGALCGALATLGLQLPARGNRYGAIALRVLR